MSAILDFSERSQCIQSHSYPIASAQASGFNDCATKTKITLILSKFVSIFTMVLPVVIAGVLTTIGAYIGTPAILSAVGFTKAGVAVGSIAAAVQVMN